jgi:endonuclease/exonuclease/phosphatase family metal-dependent hydrolase
MRAQTLNLFGHDGGWPAWREVLRAGRHHGASVASRWPILAVHEVDLHLTPRTGNHSCGTVIAEVQAPEPLGRLLVACHGSSWAAWAEAERELQALAVVRRIEELVADDPIHVVVDYLPVRCGDHLPTLRVADCRLALEEPVDGVLASDHYGVVADLQVRDQGPR